MNRRILTIPTFLSLLATCTAQEPKPAQKPEPTADAAAVVAQVLQQLKDEHIAIDLKAKTVTIDAVMNQPPDPIEYLLIHRRGKMHEAIFFTNSKPSVIWACSCPASPAARKSLKPASVSRSTPSPYKKAQPRA